tara:strand:+ start:613 stop:1908 length:1296 start_codon:yes stop_codon:yes gene_type:complete
MSKNKIGIIGIGKLGLPLALSFLNSKVEVKVYDIDESRINTIKNKSFKTDEAGVPDLLEKYGSKLDFADSVKELVEFSNTIIILVNTQINETYSSENVITVVSEIVSELNNNEKYEIVISSTVMPGDINNKIKPILNSSRAPIDIFYIPDFVKLGSVIYDFENPDFLIVGSESSSSSLNKVLDIYRLLIKNDAPIKNLTISEAELAKLAFNTFYLTKLSFVNMLSNICNELPDTNVDAITNAIGPDPRINNGNKFFKGGTAFGGTCLHRDINAFIQFTSSVNINPGLVVEAERINSYQNQLLYQYISEISEGNKTVGIYGVTFKPGTDVITHSASLEVIKLLLENNSEVKVFDESDIAVDEVKALYGEQVSYSKSANEFIDDSDIIVIMHMGQKLNKENIELLKNKILIDPWRNLEFNNDYELIQLGYSRK